MRHATMPTLFCPGGRFSCKPSVLTVEKKALLRGGRHLGEVIGGLKPLTHLAKTILGIVVQDQLNAVDLCVRFKWDRKKRKIRFISKKNAECKIRTGTSGTSMGFCVGAASTACQRWEMASLNRSQKSYAYVVPLECAL